MKTILSVGIALIIMVFSFPVGVEGKEIHSIYVNSEKVIFEEKMYLENGRVFVPVRFVAEHTGSDIIWHPEKRVVELRTDIGDVLWFSIGEPKVRMNDKEYMMDVSPFIRDGRTYLPIRHVSEFIHAEVSWESQNGIVGFNKIPLYNVKEGDTLQSLSEYYGVSVSLLGERNGIVEEDYLLNEGHLLKVIIPQLMKEFVHPDLDLLARLIFLEAGNENFIGQVAIGNVVMNRVDDDRFPDTIKEVIYQSGQFTPVMNNSINLVVPSQSTIEAAKIALQGHENYVEEALFFYNPSLSNSSYFRSKSLYKEIGNHQFMR